MVRLFLVSLWVSAEWEIQVIVCVLVWSHVDLLGAVTKTSVAVDEGPAFGPGMSGSWMRSTPQNLHVFTPLVMILKCLHSLVLTEFFTTFTLW